MRALGLAAVLVLGAAALAACTGDGDGDGDGVDGAAAPAITVPVATVIDGASAAALAGAVGDGSCDALDVAHCLLPFPSDRFTEVDDQAGTGRRIALPEGQLENATGIPLDPTDWEGNDGFSPGSPMMAVLAGVDLEASGAPPIGDLARSLADDSPTVVVDLETGERLAHWAELDAGAGVGEPTLILRSAAALPEGHEIGVALRSLVDEAGDVIEPAVAFRAYRDNLITEIDEVEARRGAMEELFAGLAEVDVAREDLQLAWHFTVASAESIAGPLLAMRDDAFERLGDGPADFRVDQVVVNDLPPGIARRVLGTFEVPLYLSDAGAPGARLVRAEDGMPVHTGASFAANFTCQIPEAALDGEGGRARPVVYGHGLMGSAGESQNRQVATIASTNTMVYCATDWIGMSESDIGVVAGILSDMSQFPKLPERSLQGIVNTLVLARTMRHEGGFGSDPAFHTPQGESVIDSTEAYFDGNSQGHIMGGAATAVSTEWTKAVLGVGGMNYSLLLDRSVDFDSYFVILRGAYPDRLDQLVLYGVIQMLWDRSETNGYAQHLGRDPYPGTPDHQVLVHVAFGDHQVATWSAEIQARTMGAVLRGPALADGRHPDAQPFFGLEVADEVPAGASALVYWDSGTLAPPLGNLTPRAGEAWQAECGALREDQWKASAVCADSHEDPRRAPGSIAQKDAFFRPDGRIIDPCAGEPCTAPNRFTLDD
jgi:hypothetical protein